MLDYENNDPGFEVTFITQQSHWCDKFNRLRPGRGKDYTVADPFLALSQPCKKFWPHPYPLAGFICGSGMRCLQVPAACKRHILMGLPLLCLIAALTSATTPTLGPWLTPCIQGSGSGQQTSSEHMRPVATGDTDESPRTPLMFLRSFQRGRACRVFTTS